MSRKTLIDVFGITGVFVRAKGENVVVVALCYSATRRAWLLRAGAGDVYLRRYIFSGLHPLKNLLVQCK